jgi:hypothetical protein
VDGKTYWWCDAFNKWAVHEPKDCKANKGSGNQLKPKPKAAARQPLALSIAKALVAVSNAPNTEDDDEE